MKKFCFDIDGVICKTIKSNYKNSKPNFKVIKFINKLYDQGFYIIIFTSRYMGRNNENIKFKYNENIKTLHNKIDEISVLKLKVDEFEDLKNKNSDQNNIVY
jgi:histidinol phosphatase-like enzyme